MVFGNKRQIVVFIFVWQETANAAIDRIHYNRSEMLFFESASEDDSYSLLFTVYIAIFKRRRTGYCIPSLIGFEPVV